MADYVELFVDAATDYRTTITLRDDNGSALNLVAFSVQSQVRKSYQAANATVNFFCSKQDAANGVISLELSAANSDLTFGRYVFDVYIRNNDNYEVSRVVEGPVFVSPKATIANW